MDRPILASLGLLAALAVPVAAADRTIAESYRLTGDQDVRLDFPVGELRFVGAEGDAVEIEIDIRCKRSTSRCLDAMEEIELVAYEGERRLTLEVDRHPKWLWDSLQLEGEVRLPRARALTLDMGVGELEIDGLSGDLTIDMGVGEVWIAMPAAAVRTMRLDVGVGDANARFPDGWAEGSRSFLVGSEIHWDDGPGDARVQVDLGVGEIEVRLQ
jgi:hypothetical protein